jgi:hypothetical protein
VLGVIEQHCPRRDAGRYDDEVKVDLRILACATTTYLGAGAAGGTASTQRCGSSGMTRPRDEAVILRAGTRLTMHRTTDPMTNVSLCPEVTATRRRPEWCAGFERPAGVSALFLVLDPMRFHD